ncbi:NAD(P)-binding protein [Cadophora sp. DSE1049]|nr:NAD(P)-binding protein [Cadophora sp. DSE1049]
MAFFNPATDIPDLSGKVIFITGGNAGLGKEAALQLSKHSPSKIIIGSRSTSKGHAAISSITALVPTAKCELIQMDLASLSSVHAAAKSFLSTNTRLDILMNNAGIMAVPPDLTADGYEIQFGTNHLGHALLTKLLLPLLLATAERPGVDVRVINLTSDSHRRAPVEGIQFDNLRSSDQPGTAMTRYGQSKLANILYTKELGRRYPTIKVVAIHPGVVKTDLQATMRKSFLLAKLLAPVYTYFAGVEVEEGARNQLWAATAKGVESGKLYYPVGEEVEGSVLARDGELAGKLWEWTERELSDGKYKL